MFGKLHRDVVFFFRIDKGRKSLLYSKRTLCSRRPNVTTVMCPRRDLKMSKGLQCLCSHGEYVRGKISG